MPFRKALQLVEKNPSTLETSASGAPGVPRSRAVQTRPLQAARDINAKLEELENDVARLAGAFGQSRDTVMAALHQRSLEVMADVMRVSTRLEQNTQEQYRTLDGRLTRSVSELGQELSQAGALMQAEQARLDQLQSSLDTLTQLHSHLAETTLRRSRALEAVTTDNSLQLQTLRTHVEGLNALYREQQQALLALTADHQLLAIKSEQTEAKLASLTAVVAENRGQTRRGFRIVASAMAVLAMVSLGLIAYFQLYPSAVPETVKTQLADLAIGFHLQQEDSEALRSAMEAQDDALAHQQTALSRQLKRQGRQMAGLEAETAHHATALRTLETNVAALQAQAAMSSAAVPPAAASAPAP